jgi:acylphosphatase
MKSDMSELAIMTERARFVFTGRFRADSFIEFVRHRAARLGLWINLAQISDEAITVNVSGAADLVDAFEMACSLGPHDCLVLDVARHDSALAA